MNLYKNFEFPTRIQGLLQCLVDSSPQKIRAGSDSARNYLWCIPQKPDTNLADSLVGSLINETDSLYNRIWTNGSDPEYPETVAGGMQGGIDGVQNQWYYQLVYDKEHMKLPTATVTISTTNSTSMVVNFTTPGSYGFEVGHVLDNNSVSALGLSGTVYVTSVSSSSMSLSFISQTRVGSSSQATISSTTPYVLWDTARLSLYFDRNTIRNMRQYYCNKVFASDPTGMKLDRRCFGYLRIKTDKFIMLPMTKLSMRATIISSSPSLASSTPQLPDITIPSLTIG